MASLLYGNTNHAKVSMEHLLATAQTIGVDCIAVTEPYASGGRISAPDWVQWIVGRSAILARKPVQGLQIPVSAPDTVCVNLGSFTLICTYVSPNSPIDLVLEPLEQDLRNLTSPILLVGDFNCRTAVIPGYQTDQRGERFEDFILTSGLAVNNPPSVTWTRGNLSGVNDYFCSRGIQAPTVEVLSNTASLSDHLFVLVTVDQLVTMREPLPKLNKDQLLLAIEHHNFQRPDELHTPAEIDEYVLNLQSSLQALIDEASEPRVRPPAIASWWTPQLDRLRIAVNKLHRRRNRHRRSADYDPASTLTVLLATLEKVLRRTYRNLVARSKLEAWRRFISAKTPWGKPYNVSKALTRGRREIPALRRPDGSRCSSIAENTAHLLSAKFGIADPPQVLLSHQSSFGPPPKISAREISAIVKRLNNRKACGPDRVPVSVVKALHRHHPALLPRLFTACLVQGHFPGLWKVGRVVFICKPSKDATLVESYRPITLLSFIGKVFERVLNDAIVVHLNVTRGLHEAQYGFRQFLGTEEAIHKALDFIKSSRTRHRLTAALSCDIRGAFDNADWNAILNSEPLRLLPHYILHCLRSYFTGRVVTCNELQHHLSRGCPQGSILGPTLWNVIHDTVIRRLVPLCEGVVCFADDTLLIVGANTPQHLGNRCADLLGEFKTFLQPNGLELNEAKTEFVVFRNIPPRLRRLQPGLTATTEIRVAGTVLRPSTTMRYLGVFLDEKLTFLPHLHAAIERGTRALLLLQRLCPNVHGYHPDARRVMVQGAVHTHLYYCSSVWHHRLKFKKHRDLIASLQRRCDRMITSAYRTISGQAAAVLAANPPLDLLILRRSILWLRDHRLPIQYWGPFPVLPTPDPPADAANDPGLRPIPADPPSPEWHRTVHEVWQARWAAADTGRWTFELFPSIADRLRLRFVHTFWRTQGLSGHGVFGHYLFVFHRRASSSCYCGHPDETARHVFRDCPLFALGRPRCWLRLSVVHLSYIGRTVRELWLRENPDVSAPGSSLALV